MAESGLFFDNRRRCDVVPNFVGKLMNVKPKTRSHLYDILTFEHLWDAPPLVLYFSIPFPM